MTDAFLWRAIYGDGTVLNEYDEAGQSHGWAEVDQSRLVAFELVPQREGLPMPHIAVSASMRPIFFRRRQRHINLGSGERTQGATVTVLGFQKTIRNVNVKCLTAYFDDGSVLVTDDDTAIQP